ncbi:unnamed protein product [Ectocarpus sp. CCAP 1310/34]|nr:unnamed protein product [Ectocarpus sp. CCAP 1310/34]
MKPSISIDLPGWCTLQRDPKEAESDELLTLVDDVAGSVGTHDLDGRGYSSNSNASGENSGNGDNESDDDDDAIARLFSVGGLKRKRSSDSRQQTGDGGQTRSSGSGIAGRAGRGTARSNLEAEAYADWPCVRCTFINAFTEFACGGCGGANKKRDRLLRERREEAEKLSRLQTARRRRDRREQALKDVLEDSSDSENDDHNRRRESPASHTMKPVEDETPVSTVSASETTSAAPADDNTGRAKTLQQHPGTGGGCVISILPPDLLLQCAEYLGDARSLCRVREVCVGWLLALDDREAGNRLWRPLFYRLRASGSIHKATDATGQQNRQLKVYDLGTTPPNRGSSASAFGNGLTAGVSTPSPSLKTRLSSGGPAALAAGKGTPWSAGSGSAAAAVVASSCVVCGLIQRDGYSGKDCEMCASALVVVRGRESPAMPRLAYTRVNLSGGGGSSSSLSSPTTMRRQQHPGWLATGAGSSPSPDLRQKGPVGGIIPPGATADGARQAERSSGSGSSSGGGGAQGLEEEFGGGARSVDWHFLVKRLAEEKRIARGWGSLQHGWVWLQRELQASTPTAAGRAAADGEPDPRIARLVRKLSTKKWVVLYDSLKATFTLQAEGIAREVVFAAAAAAAGAAAREDQGKGVVDACGRPGASAGLEGLKGCVAAWEAYKDWCEEVDMYCELLNEHISAERYRTAGAGCGRGDNTPYIRDTALISFRHSFALNVQVCAMLRMAISKGMPTPGTDSFSATGPPPKAARYEPGRGGAKQDNPRSDAATSTAGDADELFTDLELMEDSRAIDFSVRSFSGPGGGGGAGGGPGSRGASTNSGACGGGVAGSRALRAASASRLSVGSSRPGNYYDWFLSKLEGKEAGIIRGDIDARGKRVVRSPPHGEGNGATGGGAGGVLQTAATQAELLEVVGDMVEELDVPDDALSKDRHTQGAMRRLLLLPVKRWQAAAARNDNAEGDPRNLLMAGLSPAPGKEGFHRLRGGAAGRRRKGAPPMSSLGKDAGKSWEHLSTFFG